MNSGSAIRRGYFRNLAIAVLVPTFLWSGMPAIGCSCADDSGVSIALELLSKNAADESRPSYCHCASCPSHSGGRCCCAKPPADQEKGEQCDGLNENEDCVAVVRDRVLTTSSESLASPHLQLTGWMVMESAPTYLACSTFQGQRIEWNTGPPPPIDLIVSLGRLLI